MLHSFTCTLKFEMVIEMLIWCSLSIHRCNLIIIWNSISILVHLDFLSPWQNLRFPNCDNTYCISGRDTSHSNFKMGSTSSTGVPVLRVCYTLCCTLNNKGSGTLSIAKCPWEIRIYIFGKCNNCQHPYTTLREILKPAWIEQYI